MLLENLQKLYLNILNEGGSTYDTKNDMFISNGYAVSIHKEYEEVVNIDDFTTLTILKYYEKNYKVFKNDPNAYFGFWIDGNKVYLDISNVYFDFNEAVALGKENKQLAIYDLSKNEDIRL